VFIITATVDGKPDAMLFAYVLTAVEVRWTALLVRWMLWRDLDGEHRLEDLAVLLGEAVTEARDRYQRCADNIPFYFGIQLEMSPDDTRKCFVDVNLSRSPQIQHGPLLLPPPSPPAQEAA